MRILIDRQVTCVQFSYPTDDRRQHMGRQPSVHTAASLFQNICYQNKDALSAGIIVAGWDKEDGPSVYNIPLGGGIFRQPWAIGGSGSTYVYGYCDATYQDGWGKDETIEFVKNSTCMKLNHKSPHAKYHVALSLAMARDGSSGGVIRMCVITEDGVERLFVPGNQLPKFWQGQEVIGKTVRATADAEMIVEV